MATITGMGTGLARRLRTSRVWAGLDQADISARLGVSRQAVSSWEQGRTEPSATNFVRWAQVTGQSLEWLAEGVAETTMAPAEAEAIEGLSQHSVRPKGLEPLTFWLGAWSAADDVAFRTYAEAAMGNQGRELTRSITG